MRQLFIIICILGISYPSFGQTSSIGINISAFERNSRSVFFNTGVQFAANYRVQLSEQYGIQTEVVYGDFTNADINFNSFGTFGSVLSSSGSAFPDPDRTQSNGTSSTDLSRQFIIIHSAISFKIFDINWLNGEILIGPGLYKEGSDLNALVFGELFLYEKVSDKIALGLPISVNHIFGYPRSIFAIGLSIRYYL